MKFFIAFVLIVAVASATIVTPSATISAELQEIIAAINSPSTDPATAAALELLLLEAMGVSNPEPISVGPAIIDSSPISVGPAIIEANPISVGPEIIDFPLPDGGAVSAPVEATPVIVSPAAPAVPSTPLSPAAPLVQIILNINQAAAESSPVAVAPVAVVDQPEPIIIVESAAEPVTVVEAAPEPVIVPSPVIVAPVIIAPEPVIVVENEPIAIEPVIIGTPIIPSPAVNLPEILN